LKEIEFTAHAKEMLIERNISREYVYLAINEPRNIEKKEDGTTHYLKSIKENEGRVLRVVTESTNQIIKVITLFFDRRAGRIT
jgi:hypothetical protein